MKPASRLCGNIALGKLACATQFELGNHGGQVKKQQYLLSFLLILWCGEPFGIAEELLLLDRFYFLLHGGMLCSIAHCTQLELMRKEGKRSSSKYRLGMLQDLHTSTWQFRKFCVDGSPLLYHSVSLSILSGFQQSDNALLWVSVSSGTVECCSCRSVWKSSSSFTTCCTKLIGYGRYSLHMVH